MNAEPLRIYMAGYYSAHGTRTTNALISKEASPRFVLESYHYTDTKKAQLIRNDKRRIFLDSGAFSMFMQGVKVDLQAYATFILENQDVIEYASNLDVIGKGNEEASYKNQKTLEGMGVKVFPVHHARDKDEWLQKYLDEGYEYIFLGGMVPESTPYLTEWLDHVWDKYLTNSDGTAKVKVHGFGLTTIQLMLRYPWFSLDSTRWVMASRFGMGLMELPPSNKTYIIDFSDQSPRQADDTSWHYNVLKPRERGVIDARLAELETSRPRNAEVEAYVFEQTGIPQGYNPEALAKMYGWRDHFNINYFNRLSNRGTRTFFREQGGFF